MKKNLSKFTAFLLTLLILTGLFNTTAFVVNNSLPPSKGGLTIHKYLMTDITQAGLPNDGNEITNLPTGATPLDGVTFKLYKIELPTTGNDAGKAPSDGDYVLNSMTSPTTLTSGGVIFNVTVASTASITTAGGGIAAASNLPQGLYLVVESPNAAVASPAAPFVVPVPMTNKDGNGWIENVHVYPKNESMSAEKTPSTTSVKLGEVPTWTVIASIPSDIAASKAFSVIDGLDTSLNFVAGSVKVEGLATKNGTGTVIAESGNWTTSVSAPNILTVNFKDKNNPTPNGLNVLANYKFVKITFDTTVNEQILALPHKTVENKATVNYTNRYSEDKIEDTPITKIHTGTVKIDKTDARSNDKLAGAQFRIASSEANATDGNYFKKTADGKIVDINDPNYSTSNDWIETTAGDGSASFAGLKDYTEASDDSRTFLSYWLVETQAPTGHNLLTAPVVATFTEANSTEATEYTITISIKNTTGFTLPITGGTGTILFTVFGVALIGIGVMLFLTTRKKNKTKK